MYVLAVILLIAIIIFIRCIRIVPQAKAYVIERLGAYKTTWDVGFKVKAPFIERVAKVSRSRSRWRTSRPSP